MNKVETIYPNGTGEAAVLESDGSVTEYLPNIASKYEHDFCRLVVKYFQTAHTRMVNREVATPKGAIQVEVEEANPLPTLAGFAASIGVSTSTLAKWRKKYPEFDNAVQVAQAYQEDMLTNNALRGKFAAAPSIFAMKNLMGWRDKIEHSGDQNNPIRHAFVVVPAKDPIGASATTRATLPGPETRDLAPDSEAE